MPHTRSAKKRLRQNIKRRLRNRAVLRALKEQLKRVKAAADAGNLDALRTECRAAIKKVDKAADKGYIHRNAAARKKSQIARLLHAKESAGASPAGQ
jgi:small subunit ribosomal protein S20